MYIRYAATEQWRPGFHWFCKDKGRSSQTGTERLLIDICRKLHTYCRTILRLLAVEKHFNNASILKKAVQPWTIIQVPTAVNRLNIQHFIPSQRLSLENRHRTCRREHLSVETVQTISHQHHCMVQDLGREFVPHPPYRPCLTHIFHSIKELPGGAGVSDVRQEACPSTKHKVGISLGLYIETKREFVLNSHDSVLIFSRIRSSGLTLILYMQNYMASIKQAPVSLPT